MHLDFGSFRVREAAYSPGLRQPRHSHEHSNVTIVVAGQLHEASSSGEYTARPSSVVVKAAGCEHEDRISGFGARTLTIQFAPDSPLGAMLPPRAWAWLDDPQTVRRALVVQNAFEAGNARQLHDAALALIGGGKAILPVGKGTIASPPPWLPEIRALLDERFDQSVRFDNLARDLGLHPVYVSRAFRRHFGVSMTDYVRDLRIRHARHALASSRRSIAAIAAESGFSDASHLCRTFMNLLGLSPRMYRRAARV